MVEKVLTLALAVYDRITLSIVVKRAIIQGHLHLASQNLTFLITPINLGDLHVFYKINYGNLRCYLGYLLII